MSGEEESNDQIDAQDTNENSVWKNEILFQSVCGYNKYFFLPQPTNPLE